MTTESAPWQGPSDHQRPQQTKTFENAPNPDDSKRVLKIRTIFGNMLATAIGSHGLPLNSGGMHHYDVDNRVYKPGIYDPGRVKAARFDDRLLVMATTSDIDGFVQYRHELRISDHDVAHDIPDTYQITPLRVDADTDPVDRYMEGLDQIASGMDDMYDFGQIVRAYNTEAKNHWPGRLSDEEAAYARIAVGRTVARPRSIIYPR